MLRLIGRKRIFQLTDIADSHQNEVFKKYSDEQKDIFITMLRDFAGVA